MSDYHDDLVITDKTVIAEGVVRLTLARTDGADLPPWTAGAHVDLQFNVDGLQCVRQYSLCGSVDDRKNWKVAVRLAVGGRGGSSHIHEAFSQGDVVRVVGPRNNFPLISAASYLFIAGGIGITPILPMIADAEERGANWRLVYCGRSLQSMPFVDHLIAWSPDRVVLHASDSEGQADLSTLLTTVDEKTMVYCCGPESMLQAIDTHCATWDGDRLHIERFSPKEAVATEEDSPFEVEFSRSGITTTVPVGRTILQMAEELGVEIDSSCQEGVCGSCETKILEGVADHRDSLLSPKERSAGKSMMVCVSRSCTARLVLDA